MKIDGNTGVLGIIGDPVAHSGSPSLHNFLAEKLGDNLVYVPFPVKPQGLSAAIQGAYRLGIRGMNVTVPHKQTVLEEVTELDDAALTIGAVNTLVRIRGGYKGYNTDYSGFMRQLDHDSVIVYDKPVIVLGAGGAAHAVIYALEKIGASEIYLLNRSRDKAEKDFGKRKNIRILDFEDWEKIPKAKYICIQCTSVGLAPREKECVIRDEGFFELIQTGVDLIYDPRETVFMKKVREHGGQAYNGLRMLMYQAVSAYELFADREVPEEVLEELYEQLDP
ncbi:MAG: shikimate dehydrogenase [Lachnospiraceae bacterium]|nr:shikimate dehydrogenase [Lachnospiraceae bacterium]